MVLSKLLLQDSVIILYLLEHILGNNYLYILYKCNVAMLHLLVP